MPVSMSYYTNSESAQIGITAAFSLLAAVDLVGNTLVCVIIIKKQYRRTPVNYLLLNLAVADIMVAMFIATRFIITHAFKHPDGMSGTLLCKLLTGGNFTWVGGAASVFTLVTIAFERYYAVMHPYRSKGHLTEGNLKIVISAIWVAAAILNIPLFLTIYYNEELDFCIEYWPKPWMPQANSVAWFVTAGAIPILLMSVLYSRVVYSLWFKRAESAEATRRGVVKVRKRVTKMVIAVSVIYGICWSMPLTVYILSYFTPPYTFGDVTHITSIVLVACNSTINPFIYVFVNQRFRQKAIDLICCTNHPENKIHPAGVGNQDNDKTNTIQPTPEEQASQEERDNEMIS